MRKHAIFLSAVLLGFVSVLSYAQAPVPFINLPLMPDAKHPGGPQFTLTVNGTGFVSNTVVNWNGNALATQFVTGSKLMATVPAANIAKASTAWVTAVNPAPGGGTSNTAFFTVTANTRTALAFGADSWTGNLIFPSAVAVGDFNGDGKLDLVLLRNELIPYSASVLLGDGTGIFTWASSPVVDTSPTSAVVGDFNGDGKLDLALVFSGSDTVSILLGDGKGMFTPAPSLTVGSSPDSAAVGDFNKDGNLDLAVSNTGSDTVSILLGDGKGNFTLASSPAVGASPTAVAVGDFNRDSNLDLAVSNHGSGTVSILLGDGTGSFNLASPPIQVGAPNTLAVGDFNGDGKLDLAVASALFYGGDDWVAILLGDGKGNFRVASELGGLGCSVSAVIGDFNGDGKLDLATGDPCALVTHILLGDGKGNFNLASSWPNGSPATLVVGDFTGNGKLDLAAAHTSLSILLGEAPPVALSPANLIFATQLVGTSNSQPVTLINTGNANLDITKIAARGTFFSQTNNCPSSLPSNGQCTINVTFEPHTRGTRTGTIRITDKAPNSPQTVPLTGVGTAVTLLPNYLDFGHQQVGTTSPPQIATLTNYGKAAVNIYRVHFTGPDAGGFAQTNTCGTSLPAGGSCTISVNFAPKYTGSKSATLDVVDNGGGSPQTVGVGGTGME